MKADTAMALSIAPLAVGMLLSFFAGDGAPAMVGVFLSVVAVSMLEFG